jgi:hypothetical protein
MELLNRDICISQEVGSSDHAGIGTGKIKVLGGEGEAVIGIR